MALLEKPSANDRSLGISPNTTLLIIVFVVCALLLLLSPLCAVGEVLPIHDVPHQARIKDISLDRGDSR